MAETLGSLCDKLTVVKLKEWHANDKGKIKSLKQQQQQLQTEIDEFIGGAVDGGIPFERLTFRSNKIYLEQGNQFAGVVGTIGEVFAELAATNCELWHEQEKVYEFEKVPPEQKDQVVKRLAVLNLQRTRCIDAIDEQFAEHITHGSSKRKFA